MKMNHTCTGKNQDFSLNISNIVGLGNVRSFNKMKHCYLLIWALGNKYNTQLRNTIHPHLYYSFVQVDWKPLNHSTLTILYHGNAISDPTVFPTSITTTPNSGITFHQLPYHGHLHFISDPGKELKNQSYAVASDVCREMNASVFHYLSETEMEYVLDWLLNRGTQGAPVSIFTSLKRSKVCMHESIY